MIFAISFQLIALASQQLPNLVSVRALRSDVLEVHLSEGHVEHHTIGHKRTEEKIQIAPLDVLAASRIDSWKVAAGPNIVRVGRKSKGTDFAWYMDRWVNGQAVNDRPDHIKDHWIYLFLDHPLREGQTVSLDSPRVLGSAVKFTYSCASSPSEAVHVNLLGYAPSAPQKFGYVYAWLGDAGGMGVNDRIGRKFRLIDNSTGKAAYTGVTKFRRPADNDETQHLNETPNGNFVSADVLECDFSAFRTPGTYRLSVEGVGCSTSFRIDADVYRMAFQTTIRGLFHNRSGIALTKPYTTYERPAPHNPLLTPGFKGKLQYTSSRMIDWKNWEASPDDLATIKAGMKGPIDVWGWYQDAGDWDGYYTHIQVVQELLLAYQVAPNNFAPKELNLPESSNGLPDILNEAAWLPRYCYRLRHALLDKHWGTGGLGLRACGDHFGGDTGPNDVGRGSWQDVDRTWIVSGEDPLSTYLFAGAAAQLARCLEIARTKDPEGVDWRREAIESWNWAKSNTHPGDTEKLIQQRAYAAGALAALTGESEYEAQFDRDTKAIEATGELWDSTLFGPTAYLMAPASHRKNSELAGRLRAAILHTADLGVASAEKRALRWGGSFGMPMLVGQQTTPMIEPIIAAYGLTGDEKYRSVMYTTADYFLGTNPLNMTWVTGLGSRNPTRVFHMDSWYRAGPWDHDWANKTVYPRIDVWPGAERWFSNQCSPMASEFTIWQNIAPSAALYGVLCNSVKR